MTQGSTNHESVFSHVTCDQPIRTTRNWPIKHCNKLKESELIINWKLNAKISENLKLAQIQWCDQSLVIEHVQTNQLSTWEWPIRVLISSSDYWPIRVQHNMWLLGLLILVPVTQSSLPEECRGDTGPGPPVLRSGDGNKTKVMLGYLTAVTGSMNNRQVSYEKYQ